MATELSLGVVLNQLMDQATPFLQGKSKEGYYCYMMRMDVSNMFNSITKSKQCE